jgi:DNA-binding IclR family transcriptional regulator
MLAAHEALEGEIPLSEAELAADLRQVRELGYWQGESRQSFGITDISVPVLGPGGVAIAALTCPHVRRIDRHGGATVDAVRERLAETAHDLSLE